MSWTFGLSLDDFSPHPRAGLNFESIGWCNELIKDFPDIKIDLFVSAAYCRLGEKPCYLSDSPEWCDKVRGLPDNYRLNLHGMYHRRCELDRSWHKYHPLSNNDELQYLQEAHMRFLLGDMREEFRKAGLEHTKVIRPPGWKISVQACRALNKMGYTIAGDGRYKGKPQAAFVGDSYNWDLISKCKLKRDVWTFGHTSDWTNNYFDEERYNLVLDLLTSRDFHYRFLGDK